MKRKAQCLRFIKVSGITFVVLLALAVVAVVGRMVYKAPGLRIEHLYVNGCENAVAEEVLAYAESYRFENILAADLGALQNSIEANPWIEQAVIRRQYPDTVAITVTVREARAVIILDESFLVDAKGVVFFRASEVFMNLPVISGLQREDFESDPVMASRMLNDGLQIIAGLQANTLPQDDNVRITCSREFGFTLQTDPKGPEIYLGFDDYQYKLSALPRMLADLRKRGLSARSIHLNSPERAFVKLDDQKGTTRQAHAGRTVGGSLRS